MPDPKNRPWQFGDAMDWVYRMASDAASIHGNPKQQTAPSKQDQSGSVFVPNKGDTTTAEYDASLPYGGTIRVNTRERGRQGDTTSQTPTGHSRTPPSASHPRNRPAHKRPATTGGANSNVAKDTSATDQALLGGGPRPGEATPPQEPGDYGFGSSPSPTQVQLANFPVAAGGLGLGGYGQGGPQSNQPEMRASTAPTVNEVLANMGPFPSGGTTPGPSAGATRPRSVSELMVSTGQPSTRSPYVPPPDEYGGGGIQEGRVAAGSEQAPVAPAAHHGASAFLMKFLQAIAGGGQHDRSGTGKAPGEAFGQPNAVQQAAPGGNFMRRRAEFSQSPELTGVQYGHEPQGIGTPFGGVPAQLPDMMQFSPPVPPNPAAILLGQPQMMDEETRRRMMGM
jgi:hypothetical protein